MSKKEVLHDTLCDEIKRLENLIGRLERKLQVAEKVRSDQVDELMTKQAELLSDVADLLTRVIQ